MKPGDWIQYKGVNDLGTSFEDYGIIYKAILAGTPQEYYYYINLDLKLKAAGMIEHIHPWEPTEEAKVRFIEWRLSNEVSRY